ncbi:hypothetical protein Tco_0688309 [Tanacetum coccineum]
MNHIASQQAALENNLVAPEKRLKIERCNARIAFTKPQKEETYQVTLEALKLSPCYHAFQITAEVPEIYMHQFLNTIKKIGKTDAYDFKLDKKKCRVDIEVFLLDRLIESRDQILWAMYNQKNVDYIALLWEDFMYQVDNREISSARKEHMPYPRFIKVIIDHFISKDNIISIRNLINLHIAHDDSLLGAMKFVSKTEDCQKYGVLIPNGMINDDIKQSQAYQTYLDYATGKVPPKNARKFKKDTPAKSVSKKKAPAKADRGKGIELLSDVTLLKDAQLKKTLRKSNLETHKLQTSDSSEGSDFESKVPNEQTDKTKDTSEGTGVKPDESEDVHDEDNNDDDDGNGDDNGNDDDGGNDTQDSERTDSDDDENPSFILKDYEEEEQEDEYVHTQETDKSDNEEKMHEEEDDDVAKKLSCSKMKEAVDVVVWLQSNKLKEEAEAENQQFINQIEKYVTESLRAEVLVRLTNQPQTSYAVATLLSEFDLKGRDDQDKDEDPFVGSDRGTKRRKSSKDAKPSKGSKSKKSKSSSSSKGTQSQPKSLSKSTQAEELEFEAAPPHKWISTTVKARQPPRTFDKLIGTPIDFSAYVMNRLKIDNLTQEILVGPAFNLLKCTCKSFAELEYNFKECYKAINDRLNWHNPEGRKYSFDLSKPLPLIEDRGRQIVPANYFINNDLEYLKGGSSISKYATSITRTKAAKYDNIEGIEDMVLTLWSPVKVAYNKQVVWGTYHWGPKRQRFYAYACHWKSPHDVYSKRRIIAVTSVKVMRWYDYGYLEEIVFRRDDNVLYKFKEGDFPRLNLRDIKDMLRLLVQKKLSNLNVDDRYDLDLQLRVESYQKKINITRPETTRSNISKLTPYTAYKNPQGIIYQDKYKRNRLMRSDELYKFCDGTLSSVRRVLHDIASNLEMDYLPERHWSNLEMKRSRIMVKEIDKLLFERRLIQHQSDTKVIHNDDGNPSRANIKQALGRFNTTAENPVKEILLKLNLLNHRSILTDSKEYIKMDMEQRSIKLIQYEVLKLKNIKKDGYTRFQYQEQYEHVGPEVTRSQKGKRSQDDDKRLCLWLVHSMKLVNNGTVASIDIIDSFGRLVDDEYNRKSLMLIAKFILWYESIPDIIVKEKTTNGSSKEISEDQVGDICSI